MKAFILLCCVAVAIASECGENSRFKQCGTACPLTCENKDNPPKICVLSCNAGCFCHEGYVKAADGRCVRPEECPARADTCGENEQYNACGTACPLTCDNHNDPPIACVKMCSIGCECKEGFVRSSDGRCIEPAQCDGTPTAKSCLGKPDPGMCRGSFPMWFYNVKKGKCYEFVYGGCQGNGNRYETKEECLSHCGAVKPKSADIQLNLCTLPRETGPCRAYMPSYYFNAASGKCEQFIYGGCHGNANRFDTIEECHDICAQKSSHQCNDLHEHYDGCGTHCPTTCDNMNDGPRACILSCNPGCHCDEGYVRNGHGICVRPDECPSAQSSDSLELCALPSETGPCRAYFKRFFFNQDSGKCEQFVYGGCGGNKNNFFTLDECHDTCAQKSNTHCPADEHYEECGTACPLTCDNVNDPPRGCVLSCNSGCFCDKGFVRNQEGICVRPDSCSACGVNKEFTGCGTACPLTCENYENPPNVCTLQCVIGCQCQKGFVKKGDDCVRPEQCQNAQSALERPDCDKAAESGMCNAYFERWYYNQVEGRCKKFVYGGCGGNKNNFATEADCYNKCGAL